MFPSFHNHHHQKSPVFHFPVHRRELSATSTGISLSLHVPSQSQYSKKDLRLRKYCLSEDTYLADKERQRKESIHSRLRLKQAAFVRPMKTTGWDGKAYY